MTLELKQVQFERSIAIEKANNWKQIIQTACDLSLMGINVRAILLDKKE